MSSSNLLLIVGASAGGALFLAFVIYAGLNFYVAPVTRTKITEDERDYRRHLSGWGVIWGLLENVVKGPQAPLIEYLAADHKGNRAAFALLDRRTGWIDLSPQECAPEIFFAETHDEHTMRMDVRITFCINPQRLKCLYQYRKLSPVLESRIQNAFVTRVGTVDDNQLRGKLADIQKAVIQDLQKEEDEGFQSNVPGGALGVTFIRATVLKCEKVPKVFADTSAAAHVHSTTDGQAPTLSPARAAAQAPTVLSYTKQQLDQYRDLFLAEGEHIKTATDPFLALLTLHTQQRIAEAMASSGNVILVTPEAIGLAGVGSLLDALRKSKEGRGSAPEQMEGH